MWREYSSGYIRNNRSSGITVIAAAFLSALLLSLLCGVFYNLWKYEVERIEREEGSWQSRITGEFDPEEIRAVQSFAGVTKVEVREEESGETVLDLYFQNMSQVLEDTPKAARLAGASKEDVTYHHALLSMYLVRDPEDPAPRLVFPFFILVTLLASVSLIVIIHNAFAVSMNDRVYQLGILSSVGATPGQIRACLMQEAAVLCTLPVLAGSLLGIADSAGVMEITNVIARDIPGRQPAVFGYHPLVFAVTVLVSAVTIWISAWIPARKLSRMTPMEALKHTGEVQLKRRKNSRILAAVFGMEGELAGNALKAQRRSLRTASLSLILSLLAFTLMQCFFTLSAISTRETYFEKYQDAWDIMVSVKDTKVDRIEEAEEIRSLPGVENAVVYQKVTAKTLVAEEELSADMKANGGFSNASREQAIQTEEGWLVHAPLVIMDDNSFLAYCEQIGVTSGLDGAVIRNQISDVMDPDFRHARSLPYLKEENSERTVKNPEEEGKWAQIPVLAYTEEVPVLREEYGTEDPYELVYFLPASLWTAVREQIGVNGEDSIIRILAKEPVTQEALDGIESDITQLLGEKYTIESENRIQEKETNDREIQGMMLILGGFCVLLALIGISSVFSNTLGYVRQRRREFARYLSVGMTPAGLRKMFCIEALVIAGRPVLITLPVSALIVWYMLRMSYMEAETFFDEAPVLPVAVFILAILGAVAFAYYLGWRRVRKIDLAEALRDDTMF